ncbi:MAG: helix-turn-helix transcriptional regulator [Treponema sp.]|nr:helix-turn-helix transcriptional regulator [Treponema sp.]
MAKKAGFDPSNIGRGIRLKSSPSVETAVKIAEVLNVSVEYLIYGKDFQNAKKQNMLQKYASTLEKLESIPEKSRNSILSLIENVSADCK